MIIQIFVKTTIANMDIFGSLFYRQILIQLYSSWQKKGENYYKYIHVDKKKTIKIQFEYSDWHLQLQI